jgi:uncharacterized Tic20 family protein
MQPSGPIFGNANASQSSAPLRPSAGEKVMAAMAHLSILMPHFGILAPLVIWLVNNDSAPYAAYQAKQAFFFHLLLVVLFWVLFVGAIVFGIVTFGWGALPFIPILLCWYLVAGIYGIVAAVKSLEGRDFRYLFIGQVFSPND